MKYFAETFCIIVSYIKNDEKSRNTDNVGDGEVNLLFSVPNAYKVVQNLLPSLSLFSV